ncbi:JAB domain-containing protein [Sphingomonas sp. IW22]|uniref:JAB domain-containing protein n=1 Tax=Sphingomonas sp. IW22 TaxID=3242489 RepID=UPI0035210DB1
MTAARAIFAPLAHAPREVAAFAYLDRAHRVIALRYTPAGSVAAITLPIRTVAREALVFDAAGLLMAHNHPSNDARPSAADIDVTRRFERALAALDLKLIDHLILTPSGVASFRELGLL